MEKLIVKGKKEIRLLLTDSLHQTIQALGVANVGRKADKIVDRSAKRLSTVVARQMKKELKKIAKLKKKVEKKKDKQREPVEN